MSLNGCQELVTLPMFCRRSEIVKTGRGLNISQAGHLTSVLRLGIVILSIGTTHMKGYTISLLNIILSNKYALHKEWQHERLTQNPTAVPMNQKIDTSQCLLHTQYTHSLIL